MRILIIDDEKEVRGILYSLIEIISQQEHEVKEADGVASGLSLISEYKPDLVFLDVEMGDGNGFDLLSKISNPSFQLVFITAHNKYAIQAFKCSAIDYLLKPIDIAELAATLHKASLNMFTTERAKQFQVLMNHMSNASQDEKQIILKDMELMHFIKVSEVLYCEASSSYTKVFIQDSQPILVSKTLSKIEELFHVYNFVRVHHSYLVNPRYIKSFDKVNSRVSLQTKQLIPVSVRKRDYVIQYLESWCD